MKDSRNWGCNCLSNDLMKFKGANKLCPCKQHKRWCCKNTYTGSPYSPSGEDYSNHLVKAILDF